MDGGADTDQPKQGSGLGRGAEGRGAELGSWLGGQGWTGDREAGQSLRGVHHLGLGLRREGHHTLLQAPSAPWFHGHQAQACPRPPGPGQAGWPSCYLRGGVQSLIPPCPQPRTQRKPTPRPRPVYFNHNSTVVVCWPQRTSTQVRMGTSARSYKWNLHRSALHTCMKNKYMIFSFINFPRPSLCL